MTEVIDMSEAVVLDVDTAKAVLISWLYSWRDGDWKLMAPFTAPIGGDVEAKAKLLASNFSGRKITKYTEPKFKDGNADTPPGHVKISFADFDVSVDLADGRGSEYFVARVVGIGDEWGVNAISTMKRTTSPPGKGQQCQRRPRIKAKRSTS